MHPDRGRGPEAPQPRAPEGRGPRGPAMSPTKGPPWAGSAQQDPSASRAHPLRRRRSACRPERLRRVPSVGAVSAAAGAASRRAGWARGARSSPPRLATPSGAKVPTCKAKESAVSEGRQRLASRRPRRKALGDSDGPKWDRGMSEERSPGGGLGCRQQPLEPKQ